MTRKNRQSHTSKQKTSEHVKSWTGPKSPARVRPVTTVTENLNEIRYTVKVYSNLFEDVEGYMWDVYKHIQVSDNTEICIIVAAERSENLSYQETCESIKKWMLENKDIDIDLSLCLND